MGAGGPVEAHFAAEVAGDVRIGGCSYRAATVTATFMSDAGWIAQEILYFTDLGFGALVATYVSGEPEEWRVALSGLVPVPDGAGVGAAGVPAITPAGGPLE
jgi:hypothetical protein